MEHLLWASSLAFAACNCREEMGCSLSSPFRKLVAWVGAHAAFTSWKPKPAESSVEESCSFVFLQHTPLSVHLVVGTLPGAGDSELKRTKSFCCHRVVITSWWAMLGDGGSTRMGNQAPLEKGILRKTLGEELGWVWGLPRLPSWKGGLWAWSEDLGKMCRGDKK